MASEIGKIVHCVICGAPIVAKGNRLFCEECYNQNRRNAAQRSNARSKMEREQRKREVEKMKQNNKTVTAAADLNMRAKLADLSGNVSIDFYATVRTADGREYKVPLSTANLSDGVLTSLLDGSGFTLTTNGQ